MMMHPEEGQIKILHLHVIETPISKRDRENPALPYLISKIGKKGDALENCAEEVEDARAALRRTNVRVRE